MNSNPAFPIVIISVFIAAIIALIVGIVVYSKKKAAERRRAMEQAAQQLGWTFMPDAPLSIIPGLEQHHLFSQGHSKSILNLIQGSVSGGRAAVFDYRYTVGHGKNQATFNQSILYFQTNKLNLPFFSLRPESFGHKLISALGYQDIDFAQRPDFSKKYLLRGQDEQAIRNTFHDAALAYYENNLKLSTDAGANEIFFYRQNVRVEPLNVRAFVDWGMNMLTLFQRP